MARGRDGETFQNGQEVGEAKESKSEEALRYSSSSFPLFLFPPLLPLPFFLLPLRPSNFFPGHSFALLCSASTFVNRHHFFGIFPTAPPMALPAFPKDSRPIFLPSRFSFPSRSSSSSFPSLPLLCSLFPFLPFRLLLLFFLCSSGGPKPPGAKALAEEPGKK
eukprot:GHVT01101322.1.p1 GENE.GHVT01101322.1~~GHVT01101322.1.p1  ORF type:complete len:163 (+),score=39.19 GHVT01101322.1:727-1215(+)